jgi:hypothetical protein
VHEVEITVHGELSFDVLEGAEDDVSEGGGQGDGRLKV